MFSQDSQDRWIIEFLRGKRDGYFLDTGASNGIDGSNTYLLEKEFDWRGLCIEPNIEFYNQLIGKRVCDCLNVCLYDREVDAPFLEAGGTLGGLIQSFTPEHVQYVIRKNNISLDSNGNPPTVMKRTTTLLSALSLAKAPPEIDYWSLDTEGIELLLLKSFPFNRFTFNILTVEHNYGSAREPIRKFLESRGYVYWTSFVIDDCYIRREAFPGRYRSTSAWRQLHLRRTWLRS